jgi:hypothetical protein
MKFLNQQQPVLALFILNTWVQGVCCKVVVYYVLGNEDFFGAVGLIRSNLLCGD